MWLHYDVVLQRRQSRQLGHQFGNTLARLSQVLENQADRRRTVMSQMNLRHRNAAAAFTTKHAVVFDQTFGDVSLAHRRTHHAATITRGDDVNRVRSRNVCHDFARLFPETNFGSDGECHLFRERLAKIGDDPEALAICVMSETDRGSARLSRPHRVGPSSRAWAPERAEKARWDCH